VCANVNELGVITYNACQKIILTYKDCSGQFSNPFLLLRVPEVGVAVFLDFQGKPG
jgi:hypothetical protein